MARTTKTAAPDSLRRFMNSVAVTKMRTISKYVKAPSTIIRAGRPLPPAKAPARAAASSESSVEILSSLAATNAPTMTARIRAADVVADMESAGDRLLVRPDRDPGDAGKRLGR